MKLFINLTKKVRVNIFGLLGIAPLALLNGAECIVIMAAAAALHEAAHFCAVSACGGKIKRVDIGFLSAEIIYGGEKMTLKSEIGNSLSGIAVNTALSAAAYFVYTITGDVRAAFFSLCNASLAAVNLLPIRGLDGFNALYAFLQLKFDANKAYSVCRKTSAVFVFVLAAVSFYAVIETGFNTSVILLFMIFADRMRT